MDRKTKRIKTKNAARITLSGNWLKGAFIVAVSLVLGMFCSNFIPMYAPAQPLTAQSVAAMTPDELMVLFADMLIPEVITWSFIGRLAISIALFLLIIPPFQQGMKLFFTKVFLGEKAKVGVAFSWYTNLAKIFGSIRLYIYIGFLSLICMLIIPAFPICVTIAAVYFDSYLLFWAASALYFVSLIVLIVKLTSYVPAFYIYAVSPSVGVIQAVKHSVYITRGKCWEFFIFRLSFILWHIAVMFTGNIGHIFFQPYYITANAAYVNVLIAESRSGKDSNTNEESTKES